MLHTCPNYSLFNIGKLFSGLDSIRKQRLLFNLYQGEGVGGH